MSKIICCIALFFIVCANHTTFSQSKVDSLNHLISKNKGVKKGNLYLDLANQYLVSFPDSSIHFAEIGYEIGKSKNDIRLQSRSFSIKGEAYQKKNNISESIKNYLQGVKLAEKINDHGLLGTLYNGIGVSYYLSSNLNKSEQYFILAAKSKKEAKDYKYYSVIQANLASLQIISGDYEKSRQTLFETEKILTKHKEFNYLSSIYNSLGANYQMSSPNSDSILYYYQKSLEMAKKSNDLLIMMNAYQNIGDYYFSSKNYSKAIEYMQNAISTNDLRVEDQYKPNLYGRISAVYDSIKDYKNAYLFKQRQFDVNQRLFTIEKQKEIEELEIRYQSEKKEKEIGQQKQQIQKSQNQKNLIIYCSILIFAIIILTVYFILQRRKITQAFEREKLKLFENIIHDIRTPLTLIDGPIQLMKQTSKLEDQEHILLMERNSKKLINLVNELLDTSKLGKNTYQVHYQYGELNNFISSIITTFKSELASKQTELIFEHLENDSNCSYPSNALEKILTNLIENAIKYSPNNSKIIVKALIDKEKLYLEVNDNGNGIPKNEQKKIFNRFYRGSQTASTTSGSGIGLSLVNDLIELLKGSINLISDSTGTTFYVSIPLENSSISQNSSVITENTPLLLLVEDDDDMANFTISILKDTFSIIRVSNGNQAIQSVNEILPDIILTDVMMPEKDGIELLQEIKSNDLTDHLPVVLFSAKNALENRLIGLEFGADSYIPKPFSPEELKLTVRNLYSTSQKNREDYKKSIHSEKAFEERIKSNNSYINKLINLVITNIDNHEYSVNELADDIAISRSQLHRKISALTGFSTTNFIRMIRLEKAKDMLKNNEGNVTEIAYQCGFNSQSYFTKSFTEHFGESPKKYIN